MNLATTLTRVCIAPTLNFKRTSIVNVYKTSSHYEILSIICIVLHGCDLIGRGAEPF